MTLVELRELIKELSFDDNAKIVVLVAKEDDNKWHVVKCDDQGRLVIAP